MATNLESALSSLGFGKNASTVYLALFVTDDATAGAISKQTNLHRQIVYLELEKLIEKKLIMTVTKNRVAYFRALDPDRLLDAVKKQELVARHVVDALKKQHATPLRDVIIREGKEELARQEIESYERTQKRGVVRSLGFSPYWAMRVDKKNEERIVAIHTRQQFELRVITEGQLNEQQKAYKKRMKGLVKIKLLPNVTSPALETVILHDRVVLRQYVSPFTLIELTHKEIVKNYTDYFDRLWRIGKTKEESDD